MKHIIRSLILLSAIFVFSSACTKDDFKNSISGTTWWAESSSGSGTMHEEFTFTRSAFYVELSYPFTPSFPPTRSTGTYTYEYPNIYLSCPDFTDIAVMDSDYKSFKLGDRVFLRK